MEDYNLNMQPAGGPSPDYHGRKRAALPQWLAILIVALALLTLLLMIMLFTAAREDALATKPDVQAEVTKTAESEDASATMGPIVVVQATPYTTENAAGGQGGGSTTTQVSQSTAPAPAPTPAPAPEQTPATGSTAEQPLTGVDEDIAVVRAQAAGMTPFSVYGFPAVAVSPSATLPPSGQVFRAESYLGRTLGEKYAFLYVQTTEPLAAAVTVPNLQGKAWRDARAALLGAGLNIRYAYEEESPSTYGTVVYQAPSSGSLMPRGCSVVVVLAD